MDPKALTPILVSALVIFALYRRVRRSFGRQPLRPGRLMFRVGLISLLLIVAAVMTLHVPIAMTCALAGGALMGLALGFVGLRHTRFETTPTGPVYIPHTYIGLFVTSLLILRVMMRVFVLQAQPVADRAARDPWATYQHNPATLGILGLVIGYYLVYNIGLLMRGRALGQISSGGAAAAAPHDRGGSGGNAV
ncbi:MAG TPA: hypothetical protein VHZ99_06965 [Steroidobacteraceae bacterium]|jgi:hypothetical protein|nr:hypothetical protein [Steroidobacteraceae bacterium]